MLDAERSHQHFHHLVSLTSAILFILYSLLLLSKLQNLRLQLSQLALRICQSLLILDLFADIISKRVGSCFCLCLLLRRVGEDLLLSRWIRRHRRCSGRG